MKKTAFTLWIISVTTVFNLVLGQSVGRLSIKDFSISPNTPITSSTGQLNFRYKIINSGSAPILVNANQPLSIEIKGRIKYSDSTYSEEFLLESYTLSTPASYVPGGEVGGERSYNKPISQIRFRKGGNIVVVWPTALRYEVGDSGKVVLQSELSTNRNHSLVALNFQLYPNPADQFIYIDGFTKQHPETQTQISVFDIVGNTVITQKCTNRIDISTLKTGVYFIRISGNGILPKTLKFIKS